MKSDNNNPLPNEIPWIIKFSNRNISLLNFQWYTHQVSSIKHCTSYTMHHILHNTKQWLLVVWTPKLNLIEFNGFFSNFGEMCVCRDLEQYSFVKVTHEIAIMNLKFSELVDYRRLFFCFRYVQINWSICFEAKININSWYESAKQKRMQNFQYENFNWSDFQWILKIY